MQIHLHAEDVARGKKAPAVSGNLSAQEALDRLLANTGLKYEFVNEHTVRVSSAQTKTVSARDAADPPGDPNGFHSAQANQGLAQGASTVSNGDQNSPNNQSSGAALTEIIVTAQKRSERLQDVPVPVTAINADTLVNSNEMRLQDYYSSVPGLSVTGIGAQSTQILSIRGIN